MSRIGRSPILVPDGVTASYKDGTFTVNGPKGTLTKTVNERLEYNIENGQIVVVNKHPLNDKTMKAFHGLYRQLIANMVKGVSEGFERRLNISGVGYKIILKGNDAATLHLGFSHPVEIKCPQGITIDAEKNTLIVKGIDKEQVGHFASYVRGIKPVEPYHAYGISYSDEKIVRKETNTGKK